MRVSTPPPPSRRAVLTAVAALTFGVGVASGAQATALDGVTSEERTTDTATGRSLSRTEPQPDRSPSTPQAAAVSPLDVVTARTARPPMPPAPARSPKILSPAPTEALCSGEGWEQRRGQAALSSLRGPAKSTDFRIDFAPGRSGVLGLTHLEQRRIEIFVRSCEVQSDALLRHVVAHELGHAYDTTAMTSADRLAWRRSRGIPSGTAWFGCSHCTDFATPAGDFAEVYAQWLLGAPGNRSRLGGYPDPAELDRLARRFFGG